MKNATLTVFLLTLLVNMVISFFIGYKYKDFLSSFLSPAIYYQAVVFISLTVPLVISFLYGVVCRKIVMWRLDKFKKKQIDVSRLDSVTKEMYQEIVEQDLPTKAQIKEMHEALKKQF
ncbi:hypothetical protein FML64_14845 [Klebsiella quasipneumoniae]|uniref:hypothetical protein n=1 Tax=Klebsiella TaxID=570 RepID=UPI0005CAFADB|nr:MULTISPECIES: hypothetical protein [Klebsiella]HBT2483458.1 hypothetical protein [Klebsiella pneumoniae]MBZ7873653.1 hypothetical protein [Klebsiella quasipneumoniae]PVZ32229.1 hypothetical protein N438_02454 [Klebsiella sp. GL120222-02]UBH78893.1 hypothetical protein LA349_09535 [Klebsiella quasipneumoniae]UDC97701.1 hypothetical protein LGM20_03325 [Klebsiella quasipneumoniae subsp. quasipneumoniae]